MADKIDREAFEFGQTLKRYREAAKVTQQDIADATGLTKNYISSVERGIHKCNAKLFITYAKLCHSSLDEMAGLVNKSSIKPELFKTLSDISDKEQGKVLQIIRLMN